MKDKDVELKIGDKVYCAFCGNEMQKHEKWRAYECEEWYTCTCDDYKLMRELESQIYVLQNKMPRPKYTISLEPVLKKKIMY